MGRKRESSGGGEEEEEKGLRSRGIARENLGERRKSERAEKALSMCRYGGLCLSGIPKAQRRMTQRKRRATI